MSDVVMCITNTHDMHMSLSLCRRKTKTKNSHAHSHTDHQPNIKQHKKWPMFDILSKRAFVGGNI